MREQEKKLKKLREMEREIAWATPPRAAKLASAIVKLKATLFDGEGR